jgi:hypothetical protein
MSRSVDDNVLAVLPGEEGAGGVDGDTLLLLFEEGVEQERILELFTLAATNIPDLLKLTLG